MTRSICIIAAQESREFDSVRHSSLLSGRFERWLVGTVYPILRFVRPVSKQVLCCKVHPSCHIFTPRSRDCLYWASMGVRHCPERAAIRRALTCCCYVCISQTHEPTLDNVGFITLSRRAPFAIPSVLRCNCSQPLPLVRTGLPFVRASSNHSSYYRSSCNCAVI